MTSTCRLGTCTQTATHRQTMAHDCQHTTWQVDTCDQHTDATNSPAVNPSPCPECGQRSHARAHASTPIS